MISSFPKTPELLKIAQRVVWFKQPENTLEHPVHFLAYLMTYGFVEDVKIVKQYSTSEDFAYALEHAPPGVFDTRSWNYWNLMYDHIPIPPMPQRSYN